MFDSKKQRLYEVPGWYSGFSLDLFMYKKRLGDNFDLNVDADLICKNASKEDLEEYRDYFVVYEGFYLLPEKGKGSQAFVVLSKESVEG